MLDHINAPSHSEEQLISMSTIARDLGRTDRSIRRLIANRQFPAPDARLNGRSLWLRSTYLKWRNELAAGKYSRVDDSKSLVPTQK
jgi:predicted DNA-binding transcriptional regulator AlpA